MRRFRTRVGVAVISVLVAGYLVFAIWYALVLLSVGSPVAIALGIALLLLPLVGAWAIAAELALGLRADRLAARLEREGGMPDEPLPTLPSGRLDPAAAAAVFPRYRAAVEEHPEEWRDWFRLALAYDASGDRRRARWATRQAIRWERSSRAPRR